MPFTIDPQSGQRMPVGAGTQNVSPQNVGGAGGGSMMGGGVDLQKLLLMAALSDPKNASKYATILQLSQPTAASLKQQESTKEASDFVTRIDEAIGLLEKGKVKTGPIAGQLLK